MTVKVTLEFASLQDARDLQQVLNDRSELFQEDARTYLDVGDNQAARDMLNLALLLDSIDLDIENGLIAFEKEENS